MRRGEVVFYFGAGLVLFFAPLGIAVMVIGAYYSDREVNKQDVK